MMNERQWLYKLTAWTVTLGLLLQLFPIWFGLNFSPVAAESLAENGTTAVSLPTAPLSISRAQSSYASGAGLIVTYTVHNSLPPTQSPGVTPGQTLTDTLTALDNFDPLADPNTVRQVILVVEPAAADFVSASLPASRDGGVYTFHLDDIPPLGKATVTIELDGPNGVTNPTELDNGATGWGMVNGRSYHAAAPPAILWPDSMEDWLVCTIDANCDDPYVIAQAAQLGQNPEALFAFVRGLGFESYAGSLRGARGTLWSEAGNSVDQASLLIALLRASGVPARYRSGQLANAAIDTLILSMFPTPPGVVGYLPDDNPFPQANPLINQSLREETRAHYWVEAYLPGLGWTDLDPAFAEAQIGDRFVATPHPAALSELAAALRHSVTLRVKVEKYHPLSGLSHSYPLDYTFSAVELVGEPVTFGHLVQTQNQGGLIFGNVFHTYTPYLMLADADALLEGEPFQEVITNFPLGTSIVTGEWLQIELRHPDGATEQHEREIYDAIGYDARINGGTINVGNSGRTDQPIVSELTLFTGLFAPSFVPVEAIDGEFAAAATAVTQGQSAYQRVNEIMADGSVSPDETDDLIAAVQAISRMTRASQRVLLLQHAAAADFGTQRLGDSFLVRPYYDTPRVHLMAWETNTITGQQTINLDLRRNKIRALPYPDQSLRGWQAFNVAYGLAAMNLESDLLQRLSPDTPVKSVANILTAAQEQEIPLAAISWANLDDLNELTISGEAKARIMVDLVQNPRLFVLVPSAPVLLGEEETVGWLRGDILSGEVIDVSEDGLHLVAVEYSILLNASMQEIGFAIAGFGQGFAGFTFVFLGEFLAGIPGDMKAAWDAALAAAEQWASDMAELLAEMGDHDWIEAFINGVGLHGGGSAEIEDVGEWSFGEFDWRVGGFNNGAAMAASVIGSADPPLPPALAARLPEHEFYRPAVGTVTVAGSGGTAVNATLQLDALNVQGTVAATWQNSAQSGLRFQQLNGQGQLWVNGTLVGSGAVTANNGYVETSGAIAYESSGAGGLGFYAPAVAGLGSGAYWGETAVTLTPQNTAELTLRGATAVLNGQVYTGALTLVTTAPVTLAAGGPAAAPHFAQTANLTTSGATLGLPPAAGNISIGGTAVSLQNGLALPNFTGTISVSEANATQDQVALNGDAHYFQLTTNPANSTTTPGSAVTFQAAITANFSGSYTVTLSAPGWAASVAPDGGLTVTPPLTAAPGDYAVVVTAQSHLYPTAVAAAEQVVTVNAIQGVDVTIQPDPIYTIPWGEPGGLEGETNNGQVQIPNAAYTVQLVNRSSQPHTFDVSVSGLNPGWLIFAGEEGQTTTQVALPAGGTTWLGLYVRPDTPSLPAPGSNYLFTVTAVAAADPAVNDSDSTAFVMPAVPFQHLWVAPSPLFALGETAVDFTIYLRNVGNAPGSFDLSAHLPDGWQLSGLQSPIAINPGQTAAHSLTLEVAAASLGSAFPVGFASPVPGQVYTQWATLNVRLVSANTAPIFEASVGCLADEQALAAALHALALAMASLEESCETGCSLALRDQVVRAAENAANYGRLFSQLGQTHAGLTEAAAHLAAQSGNAAILGALPGMTTAVIGMEQELCAISQSRPTLRLTPWLDAALPGQSVNYDLQLTNRGSLTTTYAVTVTLPGETLTYQQTVPPGAAQTTAVAAASPDLGLYLIQAEARALDAPIDYLIAQAEARLNVVDRFIQVTAVTADPPFVETGESSTTLQVEIANIAGIGLSSEVETAVYAPNGSQMWSDTIPLNILGGAPRLYDLAEVDTSGWAAGVYTITADVQLQGQPTTGGTGYGYLSVGQAVLPSHAVYPELVAPGTVTVTTVITTEMNSEQSTVNSEQSTGRTIYEMPYWYVPEQSSTVNRQSPIADETGEIPAADAAEDWELSIVDGQLSIANEEEGQSVALTFDDAELSIVDGQLSIVNEEERQTDALAIGDEEERETEALTIDNSQLTIDNFFFRVEQDDASIVYSGSWSNVALARASGGSYWRSATAGATAVYTFDGDWLNLGFIGTHFGGYVEVEINGSSQGLFDLYRREDNTPISLVFADLGAGPHTVALTVAGSGNPFSLGTRVQLDYIDYWDGTPLGDGLFEETDARVLRGGGWTDVALANASGGGYGRGTAVTAWIPFDGDSFTYQAIAYNLGGKAHLFVDGDYLDTVDLYHPNTAANALTRAFSYEGFGPGPHILQINSYRSTTTLDAFSTPGTAPFTDPAPAPGSISRYEEEHPAILYNGSPFPQTAQSWSRVVVTPVSDGQYLRSATAGDSISFDFNGSWLNLGFYADNWGGYAEIFIDGQSQGVVDLYRREATAVTHFFPNLAPGSHTVSVTVLGSSNAFSSGNRVQFDFVEFGDGSGLDDGTFEQDDPRILYAGSWATENNANASGGTFSRSGGGHALFHFAGDSFTYQAIAYNLGGKAHLYVDGEYLDIVDLYHPNTMTNGVTRTFSYEGFGPGTHVLQISSYRSQTTLDRVITPGAAPFTNPNPPVVGVTRYQEEHPAVRYNGVPYDQTAQSWNRLGGVAVSHTSDGQVIYSQTAGDTVSFDFAGSWIGLGFFTDRFSGQAEIAIDGDLVAEIDLYTRVNDVASYYFSDLGEGAHTITITVLGTRHPNSRNNRVHLDYFDVWDGQPLAEGLFEESDERIIYSNSWSQATNAGASGGSFAHSSSGTAWFPFTGDSVTLQSWTAGNYHSFEVKIDGVSQGYFNNYSYVSGPRAFSFDGLGDGPHVLEVRQYRGLATVDKFTTPATGENYTLPAPSGVIRIEEDHPDLRFNGYPLRVATDSWSTEASLFSSSGGYHARTGTAGNTMSLEFEGTWVGVGFGSASWSGVAEIFIDGVSLGTFDTSGFTGGITSIYYDDLAPGTHVISITAVSGTIMPDFIDTWDGQTSEEGWHNATLDDYDGRLYYSNKTYWGQYANQYAHEGDFVQQNLINANPNIWFTFVGRDLTLLAFNRNGSTLHVAIDGQPVGEFNMTAQYSDQPYALHFPDLGDGPHVVQIHTRGFGRVDAFEVNPDGFYGYTPQVKWHSAAPADALGVPGFYDIGLLSTIAIGDLNGDGIVELVAPSTNGRLYVYRGDGQDAGDGTPILWTTDAVGVAAEPALADLTGDGAAEIIACGFYGTFAFRHDGFQLWENDAVKCFWQDSGPSYFGWGGPTIGNLGNGPHPEIVIAARADALYVLDHQGNILASDPIPTGLPSVPLLADITGDGALNIVVAHAHSLKVYDYDPLDGLEIVWTYTLTQTTFRSGVFGSPAVADLTGDGQPEIIINWGHRVEAIKADGSLYWSYDTGDVNRYRPSPITVADVTGDGEMNLVTASAVQSGFFIWHHMLMVLTADGSLVWEQEVDDRTASASGVAAQDLTGNGVWEILWNGSHDGFLVLRGSDGKRLFNEPVTGSGTIMEYPTLGDVDGDGVADVVLGGRDGIFVISHVGHWANSRPLWNQHNYHVTNINDDWSVPLVQPNSWELHNTYRTQTPEQNPAPSYRIEITHTVGVSNVTVLTDTFSTLPAGTPPQYHWQYQLEWYAPVNAISFASELAAMQPGETRQINQGTEVAYRLPSGWNYLTLPPLYVTAARILDIAPAEQLVGVGSTAVYTLTLLNPGLADDLYSLSVDGLPAGWLNFPAQVNVPAQSSVSVLLAVTAPADAEWTEWPFLVTAVAGSGGEDMSTASLSLFNGLAISIDPAERIAPTGTAVTYTLTLSNNQPSTVNSQLSTSGLALVELPDSLEIPAETAVAIPITVTSTAHGPQPFSVTAVGDYGQDTASAVLHAIGHYAVGLALDPESAAGGPGTAATFNLAVTNLGDASDSYDLSLDVPAGWSAELDANGTPVNSLSLPPYIFNSADLRLRITPDLTAVPGDYEFSVTAVSHARPGVQASITGTVEVLPLGVTISIDPAQRSMSPLETAVWQVTITNTGSVADSYDLAAAGIVGPTAEFGSGTLTLAPGQSQTVQMSAGPMPLVLPHSYPLWVTAVSQTDERIGNEAEAAITFTGYEGVEVAWLPPSQTVTNTLSANFLLVITNTGNIPTSYDLTWQTPNLVRLGTVEEVTLPAGATAVLPVTVWAGASGVYGLAALIQSSQASASAAASLTIVGPPPPPQTGFTLYLPLVTKSGPPPP